MSNILKIDPRDEATSRYLFGDRSRPFPNKAAAERNREAILAENPWMEVPELAMAAQRIFNNNASRRVKVAKFIRLIDKVGEAIAPHSPCKKGCDSCCHIATTISSGDAERIGAAIGRKPVAIPMRHPEVVREAGAKFYKVACPFLKDGACSVYEVRPFACRQHHSLDDDASQCSLDIPVQQSSVPSYSGVKAIELPWCALIVQTESLGDIREFFPPFA